MSDASVKTPLAAGGLVAMIFASAFVVGGGVIVGAFMSVTYYRGDRTAQVRALVSGAVVSVVVLVVLIVGLY